MENASKAIILAGGFLIAMLLISVAMYVFSNIGEYITASRQEEGNYAIDEFNKFFTESYYSANNGMMYGSDAYNIYMKIQDINNDIDAPAIINYSGPSFNKDNYKSISENSYSYSYHISESTGYVDRVTIG